MKILIDGCVFTQKMPQKMYQWWQLIISDLEIQIPDSQIYILNRTSKTALNDSLVIRNLFAPLPDFASSAYEDRCLQALCQQMQIDVFVSTYNTSAGTRTSSLFVFPNIQPSYLYAKRPTQAVLLSRKRALRMASGYIVFTPCFPDELRTMNIDTTSEIVRSYNITSHPTEQAKFFAHALQGIHLSRLSPSDQKHRIEEEEKTVLEAQQLQKYKEKQIVNLYILHKLPTPLSRVYRALLRPKMYPIYLSKVYRFFHKRY